MATLSAGPYIPEGKTSQGNSRVHKVCLRCSQDKIEPFSITESDKIELLYVYFSLVCLLTEIRWI